MIQYNLKGLRYIECYFNDPIDKKNIDIIEYRYRDNPLPNSLWRYSFTHIIDLHKTEDLIFSGFKENTRYQIRRARDRDGVHVDMNSSPNEEQVNAFINYFTKFSCQKGIGPPVNYLLQQLNKLGLLAITTALSKENEIVTYHAYLVHKNASRVLLLHSASIFPEGASNKIRNLIGGANRYLHFADMQYFKNKGFNTYDFGGFYIGFTDNDLLDINRFKENFGGSLTVCYSGEKALSLKGYIYLFIRELRNHLFKRELILKRKERMRDGNAQVKSLLQK